MESPTPIRPAPGPDRGPRRRRAPSGIVAAYVIGFGSVFALLVLELLDLDSLLDYLPPGLLLLWMVSVAVSLALVAIDLVLTRLDRRSRSRQGPGY